MKTIASARLCISVVVLLSAAGASLPVAAFAAPEPAGPHPRLWLDASARASWKTLATKEGNAVSRAVHHCARLGSTLQAEARNRYMGLDWAAHASNCAIAYQATGESAHARTALHFFGALLDDWERVGDGKGGDDAARHDSGYAIRALGVHAAIVYDFLHDAPGMTPALLAKARTRFAAWTGWYRGNGYRFASPGTNYHAGYLFAVTLIAIAQGNEAGPEGARLWRHVSDQMWERDMRRAAAPGGLLEGGDWGEGWQYAPLAVASYALAASAMIQHGAALPEYEKWAEQVVMRHVHALLPAENGSFAGGDTQAETPSMPPNAWTLAGAIAGPSSSTAAGWARAEMDRLRLAGSDQSFLVFEALADARGAKPKPFPREATPTYYLAKGNGALFARSSWSPAASWMATQCTKKIDVDHLPANAGNFVLARGGDELVVDPSPYGSLSSLTSNAPTVESAQLPADYKPSQAYWSEKTGYAWARQTESAIVAARCDYADQYRFQERPSDVPMAIRDVVLVPSAAGNATAVVVDRARTGSTARSLHLRFRTGARLSMGADGVARGTTGASSLTIRPVFKSAGTPELRQVAKSDCFQKSMTRGNCSAARFPVQDYVLTVRGDEAMAVHVLDMAGAGDTLSPPRLTDAAGYRVVSFERGKRHASVVLSSSEDQAKLTYRAGPGHHVVLDAPGSRSGGRAQVSATADGAQCVVTITPAAGGAPAMDARPLAIALSETCGVKEDVTQLRPAPASIDGAAPLQLATAVHGSPSASLPSELFAPPPDAVLLPPRVPRNVTSREGCGCTAMGRSAHGADEALALLCVALLASRRRSSSSSEGRVRVRAVSVRRRPDDASPKDRAARRPRVRT